MITGVEAQAALPVIKMLAPATLKGVGKALGWAVEKVTEIFSDTFREHLTATKNKCSFIRTINQPDYPTALNDIYVNLYLMAGDRTYRDEDMMSQIESFRRIIIKGTAGAGKSMLMRFLALKAMTEDYEQVPLFIDLRDLPDLRGRNISDCLFDLVTSSSQRSNRNIFEETLVMGGFCFFLDGVDEVPPDFRDEFRRQIDNLVLSYPKIRILLSSRPDVDFSGWEEFTSFILQPLSKSQTVNLISKVQFSDVSVKQDFIDKLSADEFIEHRSFLQIPLLAVLLLMCYGEHLTLSESMTSFYDQAFEVLYRRHDRTKGLRRKHFSNLPSETFRKVLSAFCYKSLVDTELAFTDDSLSRYIEKSKKITGFDFDILAFSQDLTESVSLLQRDGSKLFFIHRTFQEYFASVFAARYRGAQTFRVYDAAIRDGISTNFGPMVAELDILGFERDWASPIIKTIISKMTETVADPTLAILRTLVSHVRIRKSLDGFIFAGHGWSLLHEKSPIDLLYEIYKKKDLDVDAMFRGSLFDLSGLALTSQTPVGFSKKMLDLWQMDDHDPEASVNVEFTEDDLWIGKTSLGADAQRLFASLIVLNDEIDERLSHKAKISIFD